MFQSMKPIVRNQAQLKGKLIAHLKLGKIFALSEPDFARLISEIEKDPLFAKLVYPPDSGPRAIFKRRYPHTRLSSNFFELKEELESTARSVDVESLLDKRKGMIKLIRRIGRENFEKYFLYQETSQTIEEIAQICGMNVEEAREVQSLVIELDVHSDFSQGTKLDSPSGISYIPIAKIDLEEGVLLFSFFSSHLARGRYVVNRERLESLKAWLRTDEKKLLSQLLKKIDWINLRQDTMQRILSELVLRQESYLRSRDSRKLFSLSQRELAREMLVAPSTVCRLVGGKSVILPWGEEKALKDLFISRKEVLRGYLKELLDEMTFEEKKKISDNELKERLLKKYRFKISRRSVNLYRREILNKDKQ